MTYTPKDRFIQISAVSNEVGKEYSGIFALDESGCVWCYSWEHKVWWPLDRNRAERNKPRSVSAPEPPQGAGEPPRFRYFIKGMEVSEEEGKSAWANKERVAVYVVMPSAPDETRAGMLKQQCVNFICANPYPTPEGLYDFVSKLPAAAPSEAVRAALVELVKVVNLFILHSGDRAYWEQWGGELWSDLRFGVARAEKALGKGKK